MEMCPTYSVNCHRQSDHCFMISSPPLSSAIVWMLCVWGLFWKQIDMIHSQTVVFLWFFSSCLSQKKEVVWVQR